MTQSILAHFDGERNLLDEPMELEPNTKLIVAVLSAEDSGRDDSLAVSRKQREAAYKNGEEEYPFDLIREPNAEYEAR